MAFEENGLMVRAQRAESTLGTLRQAMQAQAEKIREFKANFGVKENSDGSISIDFDRLVQALPVEQALELRGIIDETHNISGAPGEKPRIKLKAAV